MKPSGEIGKLSGSTVFRGSQVDTSTADQRLLDHRDRTDWLHADPWRVLRIQAEFVDPDGGAPAPSLPSPPPLPPRRRPPATAPDGSIIPDYEEAAAEYGLKDYKLIRGITSCYITDDPERGWAEIGDHLVHYMRSYAKWSEDPNTSASPLHGLDTIEKIRAAGLTQVVTPEQAIELGKTRSIGMQPLIGGLHPDKGWKSLELFVNKVLPHIKDAPAKWRAEQGIAA